LKFGPQTKKFAHQIVKNDEVEQNILEQMLESLKFRPLKLKGEF